MRITSQSGSPSSIRRTLAKRRSRVVSMGEFSFAMVSRLTPSHLPVAFGPLVSNHSAGSSQSQKDLASS